MKTALFVAALALASALTVTPTKAAAQTGKVWEIEATADQTFVVKGEDKAVITVKAGEPVTLRITSHKGKMAAKDGAVHGFKVKALADQGWDLRLKEGTEDFTLKAPAKPGEYVIECTVPCGAHHAEQKMKLVVVP